MSRRLARSVFLSFCLVAVSQPLYAKLFQSKEDNKHKVEDSAYGEVLFSYYQNKDFDALTRLLVAKERGEFTQQEDKGEVLLGGLYLRWGILDEAQTIFDTVLSQTKNEDIARRACFYLAKLYYRQGRYDEALLV